MDATTRICAPTASALAIALVGQLKPRNPREEALARQISWAQSQLDRLTALPHDETKSEWIRMYTLADRIFHRNMKELDRLRVASRNARAARALRESRDQILTHVLAAEPSLNEDTTPAPAPAPQAPAPAKTAAPTPARSTPPARVSPNRRPTRPRPTPPARSRTPVERLERLIGRSTARDVLAVSITPTSPPSAQPALA